MRARLLDRLATVRAHPRHVALAGFVTGLIAAPAPVVTVSAAVVLAVITGAVTASIPVSFAVRVVRGGIGPLVVAALVLAGGLVAQARLAALDRSSLTPDLGHDVRVTGHVLEPPRPIRSRDGRASRASAMVRIASGRGSGERVAVTAAGWPRLEVGREVVVEGRLVALRTRDAWLRRRGAHARLLADWVDATGRRRGGLSGALDALARRAGRAVSAGLDPPRAALARGMVLGRDESLSEQARDEFRASGLAHLLAASGQNVALLVALAMPALAALGLGLRGRLIGVLALIALYVPLAGAGPSIQRAGVMGAAALVATLASRRASRWYAVLVAAALTLVANPRASGDPGWQLSFAAVIAIAAFAPAMTAALRTRRVPAGVAEAAAVSAAATVATAPLLALHFERVSLVSLPANLVGGIAVAPVMWLGMIAAAAGTVSLSAAAAVNALATLPLAFVGAVAHAAASVPYASIGTGALPPAEQLALGAIGFGALGAALLADRAGRRAARGARQESEVDAAAVGHVGSPSAPRLPPLAAARVPALAVALAATLALVAEARPPAPPDPGTLVVSFLDVGQGDATLIQRGGVTVLVDTGPPGSPLLARLREAGVRRIDLLIVTHAQADHEGGTPAVLARHRVGVLLDGGDGSTTPAHRAIVTAAARAGVRRVVPTAGQAIRAGPLDVRILWPPPAAPEAHAGEDPNRRAVVAHVRDGDFDLWLPADAESDVTAGLDLPEVEALKVAHHGSEDPALSDALARLRPRLAVIEVGEENTYGHPTPQVLAALRTVPTVRRTDRDGTVRLTVRNGAMRVSESKR